MAAVQELESPRPRTLGLYQKLADVAAAMGKISKDGRNAFDKYDYVTAEAVSAALRKELGSRGIAFSPSMVNAVPSEVTTAKGAINTRWLVEFRMRFICGETGEVDEAVWFSEAIDRGDKGLNKAATAAVKYYLLKRFLLSSSDEPDADADSPAVEVSQDARESIRRFRADVAGADTLGELAALAERIKAAGLPKPLLVPLQHDFMTKKTLLENQEIHTNG